MTGITLTDEQFDTFTSVVSYMVFNKCQSLNSKKLQPHMSQFCFDCDSSIDDWKVSLIVGMYYEMNGKGERTVTNACADYISATLDGKAIELTGRQMDELNKVINYTVNGSL